MNHNGFFAMLARMKHIARWGLMRNTNRENLAEHSYDTAVIAHALAVIGNRHFGRSLDTGEIAAAALFHDVPEIITGDLPTPVKYHDPELRSRYQCIEQGAAARLLDMLPPELRSTYGGLLGFEAEQPEKYRYIKAADKISAWLKCREELSCGNQEFCRAEAQTRRAVAALELPEADYFMEVFAPAFGLTLDELQGE